MFVLFGATAATSYGIWLEGIRITAAPTPIGGNNARPTINVTFSASDMRITRL